MKNILVLAALVASLAACQKAEEATVVEAVPATEVAPTDVPANAEVVEVPADESGK